jgi:translation elongation factor EF-4
MDLDNAMPEEVADQIIDLLGCDLEDIILPCEKQEWAWMKY